MVITLYSEILAGDAERVLALLNSDPRASVEVRINSPGGSVVEGLGIYNALRARKPTVYIDGVAASIASLIAMAGARIIASENALIMMHDPWAGAEGNATNLRKTADLLDKHRDAMLHAYSRSGIAREQLLEMSAAETWMTAQEALALGFIDEVSTPLEYAAHAPACFSAYRNTPKELLMDPNTQVIAANTPARDPAASAQAARDALKERNAEILQISQPYMGQPSIQAAAIAALADPAVTVDQYRARALELVGRECTPSMSVIATEDRATDFVAAVSDALAIRAGIQIAKPHPGMRDVQGMSLSEIVRVCVGRAGKVLDSMRPGRDIIRAAMSTSDFPAILENSLGKALRTGFEAEPRTFEAWTSKATVRDFKPQSRVILGSAPDLLQVAEGGEYKQGSMDDDKAVPYSVVKFGRLVQLTWEAMVNDDLGAFLRITQAMGQAAARAESDMVYATFAENSGAGPAMQDSIDLFHAEHHNLTGSAAGVTAAALGDARVLLRRQTAVGGGVMNLVPRYLLVAPEQEQDAETLLAAAARALSQGANIQLTPNWLAYLELVVEARLTGNAFYVLAGGGAVDTYELAHLEADGGPIVTEEDGFIVDARTYKVRDVFGGRWLDWRGAVKVPLS